MLMRVIFMTLCFKWCCADLYTSMADIASLNKTLEHVINTVETYLEVEQKRLHMIKKYLHSYKEDHENMKEKKHFLGNPINALTIIHRLGAQLEEIEYFMQLDTSTEIERTGNLTFPRKEDLEGAAVGIWRLQKTYNLSTAMLAAGKLQGTYSHSNSLFEEQTSPMTASALFAVGKQVYKHSDYLAALEWLHEAHRLYKNPRGPNDFFEYDEGAIVYYIRNAYDAINDFRNAIKWTKELILLRPKSSTMLYKDLVFYYEELDKNQTAYLPLCRGEVTQPEDKRKFLHCFYKTGPSQFLRIAPVKTEELHRDPEVYLFYDTLSDDEIKYIEQTAKPGLKRAGVGRTGHSPERISKTAFIPDQVSMEMTRLSRRMADITGLDPSTGENLQVCNYGIGGHYFTHLDYYIDNVTFKHGNRIATALFYMSDVEQGGATVFPVIKVSVFPVKKAALFWYNMLESGAGDFRMYHAACPVLRGSKWIFTKWFHEFGQEFRRPCLLDEQKNIGRKTRPKTIN